MATQVKKVQTLVVSLSPKPGEINKVYAVFKKHNVDVIAKRITQLCVRRQAAQVSCRCIILDIFEKAFPELCLLVAEG